MTNDDVKERSEHMRHAIFLSYPKPYLKKQQDFINAVTQYLIQHGFEPRTLGVTDYDTNAPLTAIRQLMLESNGILTIAFRRNYIAEGMGKPQSDLQEKSYDLSNIWLTSPYCQIEPAMAYQIGLPIMILKEKGILPEGILEKGVTGTYMPEFSLDDNVEYYLESDEWKQLIGRWEGYVRKVVENKGKPPRLY